MKITAIFRLEAALTAAVETHRQGLRMAEGAARNARSCRFLLTRLGVTPAELDALDFDPPAFPRHRDLERDVAARLRRELQRLRRLARAGAAAYDLNRHIALRRALALVEGEPMASPESSQPGRPSGSQLNARFRSPCPRQQATRKRRLGYGEQAERAPAAHPFG